MMDQSHRNTDLQPSIDQAEGKQTIKKTRQFKGQSLLERQQIRREQLISAGMELYGKHGFFSVTVRDICTQAKLTERYFYESFKCSEDLFKAVFLHCIEKLQQIMTQTMMQPELHMQPLIMVKAALRALLTTLRDDPRLARILFADGILVHQSFSETVYEAADRLERMIQGFFLVLFPKDKRDPVEISLLCTGLNGYVTNITLRWIISGFTQPLEEILNACFFVYETIIERIAAQQID